MPAPTRPGRLDWYAYRWVPFVRTIDIRGADLSGATATAQVRLYPDAPGDPLVNLAAASAGAQGISVAVATTDGIPTTTVTLQINETTIEGLLPFPANGTEQGEEVKLSWGLNFAGGGFTKARWLEGDFFIVPGANQA